MPLKLELELNLSDEDLEVIEHNVIGHPLQDPKHPDHLPGERVGVSWARHAFKALGVNGPVAVDAKVKKYRAEYRAAKAAEGPNYKNAAARDAEEQVALAARHTKMIEEEDARKAAEEARFQAAVDAAVAKRMGPV